MSDLSIRDDLTRQFDAGLANVKYELQKNLNEFDPLDNERLEQVLSVFNQRLIVFQYDFLEYLAHAQGGAASGVEAFSFDTPSPHRIILELTLAILAGVATALLVARIPVGNSGHLWWKTVVTAAASAGTTLGVSAGVVTAGAGILVGGAVGIGVAVLMKSRRRSRIRMGVMQKFDTHIVPKLREWSMSHING